MRRTLFRSKIHRAVITQADLHYEGSVTIDTDLLEAADIVPYEMVHVWNITQGTRVVTYALEGPRGSGVICINGAAAHGNSPGDLVIIATFGEVDEAEVRDHVPKVIRVDGQNRIIGNEPEVPGPAMPRHLGVVEG